MNVQAYAEAVSELNEELQRVRKINDELLAALKLLYATGRPFASKEEGGLGLEYVSEHLLATEWERRKEVAERTALAAIATVSTSQV